MKAFINIFRTPGCTKLAGAPAGYDAVLLAELARQGGAPALLHVATDEGRMVQIAEALAFFAPDIELLLFPAWDCLPYDRASPRGDLVAQRIDTLSRLALEEDCRSRRIVVTTVNALLQRVPPRSQFQGAMLEGRIGMPLDLDALKRFLSGNGYNRAETVMEAGEYALRGGIIDIFAPGMELPLRIDLFGDEIDGIRAFDPLTQRTTGKATEFVLKPVSEILLDEQTVERFRSGYRDLFGAVSNDPLYEAISAGRRYPGMEHWLPLFHRRLETLFDYMPRAAVSFDHQYRESLDVRWETIADHYRARQDLLRGESSGDGPYRPMPPDRMYIDAAEWDELLAARPRVEMSPFASPKSPTGRARAIDAGGRQAQNFSEARANPNLNIYDAVAERLTGEIAAGHRTVIATYSAGARDRLRGLLTEHGVAPLQAVENWAAVQTLPVTEPAIVILGLERGFTAPNLTVISEQDILGDRLVHRQTRNRAEHFLSELSEISEGDLVVHVEHGIGRYQGLEAIEVSGAPHDCLKVLYAGDDKLYVPVENIEVLSRYGSEDISIQLDRLGGAQWQARKARLKRRIREMADALIQIAALRELQPGETLIPPHGIFEEFCARFPFPETEDQLRAIEQVLEDLGSGRPMDRLICGDVGFGKTEVALRAAFIAAVAGFQVAVVTPTTLLCRQHYKTFSERFSGLPVRVAQLSRLVTGKAATAVREGLTDGSVDIVIGTHALLGKSIRFANLGLLIVDEEQHFGVAHKERLKQLRTNLHVLTLTATPIPRTLQMAMSGVREMSLIATPPVDRLAVRTFVLPFDPLVVREAILREHFRGGQCFYVCPRIRDLPELRQRLADLVPEVKVAVAHGRMAARELEEVMTAFYDGVYDVLISTNIVESGLDIPTANTLIVHRADMFGLAQLYQLRGRIGRAKVRAYAYLTLPTRRTLPKAAEKRLHVMQTLDTLGAGFSLASYDLDIRGAGNLLGDEQSGHIREVGIELYQQMLEEAVAAARGGIATDSEPDSWTPQINIGTSVLIPERYVADLGVRLGLYRRIAHLENRDEIEAFAAEMIDRFGELPDEVENLFEIIAIKRLCRDAGVERLEVGPKGAVVSFHKDQFANPAGLVGFLSSQAGTASLRPDHRLVYRRAWDNAQTRLTGARRLLENLSQIAAVADAGGDAAPASHERH